MANCKCIVASGKSNVGKTASINLLINKLIDAGYKVDGPRFYGEKRESNDRWAIFTINGKKLGIASRGDGALGVIASLTKLVGCDYFISASHLYGDSIDEYLKESTDWGKHPTFKLNEMVILNKPGSGDDEQMQNFDNRIFADYLYKISFELFNLK